MRMRERILCIRHTRKRLLFRSRRYPRRRQSRTTKRLNLQSHPLSQYGPPASPNRPRVHSQQFEMTQLSATSRQISRRSDRGIRVTCQRQRLIRFHDCRWLRGKGHEGMQKPIHKHLVGRTNLSATRVCWIMLTVSAATARAQVKDHVRLGAGFDQRRRNLRDQ